MALQNVGISWNPVPGAVNYIVFRDGVEEGAPSLSEWRFDTPPAGATYSVLAEGADGGVSPLYSPSVWHNIPTEVFVEPPVEPVPLPEITGGALIQEEVPDTPVGTTTVVFGNPQIPRSLTNLRWGGPSNLIVGRPFVAPYTGNLQSYRFYHIYQKTTDGGPDLYHDGDGGTFQFSLQTDGADGFPSGLRIAESDHIIGIPSKYAGSGPAGAIVGGDVGDNEFFRKHYFTGPAPIVEGQRYWLVFENTSSDPIDNFISIDDFYMTSAERMEVAAPFNEEKVWFRASDSSSWVERFHTHPIGQYVMEDGRFWGNQWMGVEWGVADRAAVYTPAREVFSVDSPINIEEVGVGAMHVSGSSILTASLIEDGVLVSTADLSGYPQGTPSNDPRGNVTPAIAEFRSAFMNWTLLPGKQYSLELNSAGTFTIAGAGDGAPLGYKFLSEFSGHAEYNDGTGWVGWPNHGTVNTVYYDISFYFIGNV